MKVYGYGSDYVAQTKREQERIKEAEALKQAPKPEPMPEPEMPQTPIEDAPNPIQDEAGAGEVAEPQPTDPELSPTQETAETKKGKKKGQAQSQA